jgi:hypothetical protein
MSVNDGRADFYFYWLVPLNLTGVPGPKTTPRAFFYQSSALQRFNFIPRWQANMMAPAGGGVFQSLPTPVFSAVQRYQNDRAGIPQAHIQITGELPHQATYPVYPQVFHATIQSTGGNLLDGYHYWFMLAMFNANGYSQCSIPFEVGIPGASTISTYMITLDELIFPPDPAAPDPPWSGFSIYCIGDNLENICKQTEVAYATASAPTSIQFTGPIALGTSGMPVDVSTKVAVRAKSRISWHSGVLGVQVTSCAAGSLVCQDLIDNPASGMPADDWSWRPFSILGPASTDDPDFGVLDFLPTTFNSTNGTFSNFQGPDPFASGVRAGMTLVLRTAPDTVTATTIGDSKFDNQVNWDWYQVHGLDPTQEVGRLVYLYRGTAAGQIRQIVSATNTVLTIDKPWDNFATTPPDHNTWFLIIDPAFIGNSADASFTDKSGALLPSTPQQTETIDIELPNIQSLMILVGGYLVLDDQETPENWEQAPRIAPIVEEREIFLLSRPPGVRVIGPAYADVGGAAWTVGPEDQTLICDSTTNDIHVYLPPLDVLQGREILFLNEGPHNTVVHTDSSTSDTFSDGTTQQTISGAGGSLSFTAAGVYS